VLCIVQCTTLCLEPANLEDYRILDLSDLTFKTISCKNAKTLKIYSSIEFLRLSLFKETNKLLLYSTVNNRYPVDVTYVGLCRVGENFDRSKMAKCLVPVARRIMFCVVVGGGGGVCRGKRRGEEGGKLSCFFYYVFAVTQLTGAPLL
jgi:hypothetical protein